MEQPREKLNESNKLQKRVKPDMSIGYASPAMPVQLTALQRTSW